MIFMHKCITNYNVCLLPMTVVVITKCVIGAMITMWHKCSKDGLMIYYVEWGWHPCTLTLVSCVVAQPLMVQTKGSSHERAPCGGKLNIGGTNSRTSVFEICLLGGKKYPLEWNHSANNPWRWENPEWRLTDFEWVSKQVSK